MRLPLYPSPRISRSLLPGFVPPEETCYIRSGLLSLHKTNQSGCMNIREQEIIRGLRSTDERVRSRWVSDIFYGKGESELKEQLNKVIRICYGGPKYRGMWKEIFDTLVSLVCADIWNASDAAMDGIRELSYYFFKTARNCANSKRKFIHDCLGINDRDVSLDDQEGGMPPVIRDEPEKEKGLDLFVILLYGNDDVEPGDKTREELAAELVERYIGRISCDAYRKVLYAVDIWGWSHERIERELGITNVDQNHRRAKIALTKVVLPDIRKNCAHYFSNHRDCVSQKEADLLDRFFDGAVGLSDDSIAKAYIKLVKVIKHDRMEFVKEMKRTAREEKASRKADKKGDSKTDTTISK